MVACEEGSGTPGLDLLDPGPGHELASDPTIPDPPGDDAGAADAADDTPPDAPDGAPEDVALDPGAETMPEAPTEPAPDSGLDAPPGDSADPGPEAAWDSGEEPAFDVALDPGPEVPTDGPPPPPSPAAFRVTDVTIETPRFCYPGVSPCMDVTSTASAWLASAIAPSDGSAALLLRFDPLDPSDPDASLEVGAGSCAPDAGCAFDPAAVPVLFPGPLFPGADPCEPGVPAPCFLAGPRDMDLWFGDFFIAFRDARLAGTVAPGSPGIGNGLLDALVPVNTTKAIQVSVPGGPFLLHDFLTGEPTETVNGVKGFRFKIVYGAAGVTWAGP